MAFPTGWTRKCALVIQHVKVTADQTALPVLITAACLPAEMVTLGGMNAAQSDGGDIRFSSDSAGASQLACEIVAWTQNATPSLAVVEIWVSVNVLTATDVTIYVWYAAGGGQTRPAANAPFGSQAVWDTNYVAVHHFGTGSTLTITDSTSYANNLTNNDPAFTSAATGKPGAGACNFVAAATQRLYRNSPSGFPIGTSVFSMECWANHIFHDDGMIGWGDWPGGAGITMSLTSGNMGVTNSSGAWKRFLFTDVDNWHHFMFTLSSGTDVTDIVMYMDGVVQTSNAPISGSNSRLGPIQWRVSGLPNITTYSNVYNGWMDEVRVSKVARSATWVSTQYNSHNSPSTFIMPATPVDVGGGGGTTSITCSILISGGGAATTSALTCSIGIGYGGLATSCGTPPAATVGVGGFLYRPPITMGSITLSPAYDLNHTLTWEVSALPPGLSWDGNPASSSYGHIVGTPTLAGTYFYAYTVSSPDGQRISNSCLLIVNPGAPGTGPSDIVACSIVIAPADSGEAPCPPDAVGGAG